MAPTADNMYNTKAPTAVRDAADSTNERSDNATVANAQPQASNEARDQGQQPLGVQLQLQPGMVAFVPTARVGPPRRSVSFNRAQRLLRADDVWRPSTVEFEAQCKVVGMLGKGAFADVYKVKMRGEWAALKVLRPQRTQVPHGVVPEVMFFREARALKYCKHSNIVGCLGLVRIPAGVKSVGDPNSSHWAILQELLTDGSLVRMPLLQMSNPHSTIYSTIDALQWCLDIARAVAHMHSLDPMVIHRDLKLENVLLAREGGRNGRRVAKLSDFGLHTLLDQQQVDVVFTPGQPPQQQQQQQQQQPQQQAEVALGRDSTWHSSSPDCMMASDAAVQHGQVFWGSHGADGSNVNGSNSPSSSSSDGSFHSTTDSRACLSNDNNRAAAAAAAAASAADSAASAAPAARFTQLTSHTLRRLSSADAPLQSMEVVFQQNGSGNPFRRVSINAHPSATGGSPTRTAQAMPMAMPTAVSGASTDGRDPGGWSGSDCGNDLGQLPSLDRMVRLLSMANEEKDYGLSVAESDACFESTIGNIVLTTRSAETTTAKPDPGTAPLTRAKSTGSVIMAGAAGVPATSNSAHLCRIDSAIGTPASGAGAAGVASGSAAAGEAASNGVASGKSASGSAAAGKAAYDKSAAGKAAAHSASGAGAGAGAGAGNVSSANVYLARGTYQPAEDVSTSAASKLFARITSLDQDVAVDVLDDAVEVTNDAPRAAAVLHYDMTGLTGSYMYMAPEVFRREPYNEKADIFSLAVILYQLLSRSLLLFTHTRAKSPADVERYAKKVSNGYRPKCPTKVPAHLWAVIERCWAQDPRERPDISWVVQQLEVVLEAASAPRQPSAASTAIADLARRSLSAASGAARKGEGSGEGKAAGGCGCIMM